MRAILLAAGYGKRLGSITKKKPKCLLPVNGIPLLDIWIKNLIKDKIEKILVNTHYHSAQVKKLISESKYKKKVKITYEKKLLGTGGTFIKNIKFLKGKDCLLIHSDNYIEENLANFINFYKKKKTKISLIGFYTKDHKDSGILKIDEKNILQKIFEKKKIKYGNLANGAVYIISSKCQKDIVRFHSKKKDFTKEILPNYLGDISVFKTKKKFIDIGNKKRYSNLLNDKKNYKYN